MPEGATSQSRGVVESIARYNGEYVLAVPRSISLHSRRHLVYVFHVDDWLNSPSITNALAEINFNGKGNKDPPINFLYKNGDYGQNQRVHEFKSKVLSGRYFPNCESELDKLSDLEELMKEPLARFVEEYDEKDTEMVWGKLKKVKHISSKVILGKVQQP